MLPKRNHLLLTGLLLLSGCFWRHEEKGGDVAPQGIADASGTPLLVTRSNPLDPPSDARAEPEVMTRMDVYVLTIPAGTVSLDDSFWKRIDETTLAPETYDVLFKNGVRVGLAPTTEWEHFRQIIERNPAVTQRGDYVASDGKAVELSVRKDVESQTIFYIDATNRLQGRSYDRCENLINVTFQPAPRTAGAVRVALVPVVRSQRMRLQYDASNTGNEVQYVAPERLYDLNFTAEIPTNQFLVVAPSREGRWPTSLGSTFFGVAGATEQLERVVLLVPRIVQLQQVK